MSRSDPDPMHRLEHLHQEVDREVERIARLHGARLRCQRGCVGCCVDELTVFDVEAERIRRAHVALLRDGRPHPRGACAFLDADGSCRIYDDRPYVCRTQGLPLRWVEEGSAEYRDICPLNEDGPPVEQLPERACWTIGPIESRLAELQRAWGTGQMTRVPLRNLFRRGGSD